MEWQPEAQATALGAGATLITGVLAVIAAWRVGHKQADIQRRQVSIAERQTKILDRQTALAELTLRKALFEDRLEVYQATYAFLLDLATRGFDPKKMRPTKIEQAFLDMKERAQFLFRPAVAEALQALWAAKVRGEILEIEMMREREPGSDEFTELHRERQEKQAWLREQFEQVAEIFGSELKLSDHDMQLG